uniref:Secreted protein n=1 Tax=Heterorhabditis bacteriophora TaxID=37862 RepID=A0A1I7W8Y1_HETBA
MVGSRFLLFVVCAMMTSLSEEYLYEYQMNSYLWDKKLNGGPLLSISGALNEEKEPMWEK